MAIAGIWENEQVTVPFVAPLEIISNTPVFGYDTLSLKRVVTRRGKTQRWEISTNLMPSTDSADFFVHNVVNNFANVIDIAVPQVTLKEPSDTTSLTLAVRTAANPGSSTIYLKNMGVTKYLRKGEFINFQGHGKVYMVLQDCLSDSSGNATLNIFPELTKAVALDELVINRNNGTVLMKAFYDLDNTLGIKFTDGVLSDPGTVRFIEAI